MADQVKIEGEKAEAEAELAKALPFQEKAVQAAENLDPKAIGELKGTTKPVDTTKIIMDTVHILMMKPLDPVKLGDKTIFRKEF